MTTKTRFSLLARVLTTTCDQLRLLLFGQSVSFASLDAQHEHLIHILVNQPDHPAYASRSSLAGRMQRAEEASRNQTTEAPPSTNSSQLHSWCSLSNLPDSQSSSPLEGNVVRFNEQKMAS